MPLLMNQLVVVDFLPEALYPSRRQPLQTHRQKVMQWVLFRLLVPGTVVVDKGMVVVMVWWRSVARSPASEPTTKGSSACDGAKWEILASEGRLRMGNKMAAAIWAEAGHRRRRTMCVKTHTPQGVWSVRACLLADGDVQRREGRGRRGVTITDKSRRRRSWTAADGAQLPEKESFVLVKSSEKESSLCALKFKLKLQ
ncbi:hypothetical protein Salat_2435800 [Sesamum alatum]|uniref:Uncharacterized protein n=1 Tax=Sesamum alatum TaxID=300844 RepID=A0AAE2CFH9_9LAMI|nr:hypothetical protein Salat_2435800 [Sesamum alatum]